jgi:HNH endonuclease
MVRATRRAGPCIIEGCGGLGNRRGLCNLHRMRLRSHGDPLKLINRPRGTGSIRTDGYVMHEAGKRAVLEHVLIAERALGKPLPAGAQVHHVDGNRGNNARANLVICDSGSYHQLLHRRARAFKASGHADWRKCHICQQYDDPANLRSYKPSGLIRHIECWRARYRQQKGARHAVSV